MRKQFNINSKSELEAFFQDIYRPHLENEHKLPQAKENKSKEKMAIFLGFRCYAEALNYVSQGEPNTLEKEVSCHRCGGDLDQAGFCIDLTCIYSSWPQDTRWVPDDYAWTPEPECLNMRKVEVYSKFVDDELFDEVGFDGSLYFHSLNDAELADVIDALKRVDFAGGEVCDQIALYFEDIGNPNYIDLGEAIAAVRDNDVGFSCSVDSDGLRKWLEVNRPHITI
ncbi:hypothetical protein VCHA53O466_50184 [Vibrio chagasii]|nr:hypothetical protein VCHA53O466_50184 [Vibrio chagasii]